MLEEFDTQVSKRSLNDRLGKFNMIYNTFNEQLNCIDLLEQWKVESEEHFQELAELATKNNWEGLILRKDCKNVIKNLIKCLIYVKSLEMPLEGYVNQSGHKFISIPKKRESINSILIENDVQVIF